MTLEAAGLSWLRDVNSGATGGRQGLRRPWLLLGPPPHLPPGFSWALAGSIRQYSGACLQPIPPQGPPSCSLKETRQPIGCLVALLLCKGWENFLWLLSLPQGPTLLPWPSGGPLWCWIPTNLGLLEVSIPVCWVAFPLSLMFKTFPTGRQPFPLCPRHCTLSFSRLPTEHSRGWRHVSEMDPACLTAAFPPPSSGGLSPWLRWSGAPPGRGPTEISSCSPSVHLGSEVCGASTVQGENRQSSRSCLPILVYF